MYAVCDGDGVMVGVTDGVTVLVGVTDGVMVGVTDGVTVLVGVIDGVIVGVGDGVIVGVTDGVGDTTIYEVQYPLLFNQVLAWEVSENVCGEPCSLETYCDKFINSWSVLLVVLQKPKYAGTDNGLG